MTLPSRVAASAAALVLALITPACAAEKQTFSAAGPTPSVAPLEANPVVQLNRKTFVPALSAAQAKLTSWQLNAKMMLNGTVMLEMTGSQTTRPAGTSVRMTGRELDGRTARLIKVGKTVYLSVSGVTPAGKYVKLRAGQEPELDQTLARTDPTTIFTSLGASLRGVEYTGRQVLDSVKLECYEVTVDVAKALKAQGQPVPKGLPRTATYTLWLDSAHRPRYISFEYAKVTMIVTLSGFNTPVRITPPPASKIVR
ncbi:hypothetical protein E1218_06245 [Kribbella turkmenica]|uniref:LppX_LprAFG lipoprotein n=1 Tax=Kribbella turkmenica TaxID=2530375 RepID=A0A4R4XE42_9ACTN|nr:hypothetical protein [Kribbella turkmenica]TDD28712.1 hypothetical protein E1218_06245 [Kribbella turkmenica]